MGTLLEGFRRANADRAAMPKRYTMSHAEIRAALEATPELLQPMPRTPPPPQSGCEACGWIFLLAMLALIIWVYFDKVIAALFAIAFVAVSAITTLWTFIAGHVEPVFILWVFGSITAGIIHNQNVLDRKLDLLARKIDLLAER